jgi:hypothetical protein
MTLEERAQALACMNFDLVPPEQKDEVILSMLRGISEPEADAVMDRATAIARMRGEALLREADALEAHRR